MGVEDEVGVAGVVGGGQGDRGGGCGEVDALVGEVDEDVGDQFGLAASRRRASCRPEGRRTGKQEEGTAAVLVDAAADVEAVGGEGAGAAVGIEADEDVAAALLGAAFQPADAVAGGGQVVDAAGAFGDGSGRDRRRPGAVGGGWRAAGGRQASTQRNAASAIVFPVTAVQRI